METRQRIQTQARRDAEEVKPLPAVLTENASLAGGEYGWRIADFPSVLTRAAELGLACLGGQFQFRMPEGTYEMYWLSADPSEREPEEAWLAYARHTCNEVSACFARLAAGTDFAAEAKKFDFLRDKPNAVVLQLLHKLFFVAYFVDETEWQQLTR